MRLACPPQVRLRQRLLMRQRVPEQRLRLGHLQLRLVGGRGGWMVAPLMVAHLPLSQGELWVRVQASLLRMVMASGATPRQAAWGGGPDTASDWLTASGAGMLTRLMLSRATTLRG